MFPWGKMQSSKTFEWVNVNVYRLLDRKKMLIFKVNAVLCYIPHCVILQGNVCMFVIIGVEHFLSMTLIFLKIGIWS
jgi:hypothetical protein